MENNSKDCFCNQNGGKQIDDYPLLQTLLPPEYAYVVCSYENDGFVKSRFHVNCFTKEQALEWLGKCSLNTNLTFNTEETCTLSTKVIHSKCQCSITEPCQTMLEVILKSNDIPLESEDENALHQYPTTVILHYTHKIASDESVGSEFMIELIDEVDVNSETSGDDFLTCDFKPDDGDSTDHSPVISETTDEKSSSILEHFVRKKLYYLFEKGYSPQQAYNLYKKELHETFTKEYQNSGDKVERPCLTWVYKQYYAFFEEKHGVKIEPEDTKATRGKKLLTTAHLERTMQKTNVTPVSFLQNEVEFKNKTDPLGKKINELCKKYIPILPASNDKKIDQSDISIVSLASSIHSGSSKPSSSYIIKFNSEKKTDKLNLFPLKLIGNISNASQNVRLPEMKIIQNTRNNVRILEVTGAGRGESQNISIPSGVDGVIILTNDQGFPQQNYTKVPSIELMWNNEKSSSTKKNRRKSVLKCEDPDEIIFTDNVEDLEEKVQPQKKHKRKIYDYGHLACKKPKIILPRPLDGIENVICPD